MNISLVMMGLTDMKDDLRCISGYDIKQKKYFRPLFKNKRIDHNFCTQPSREIKLFKEAVYEVESSYTAPVPHIEHFHISKLIEVREIFKNNDEIKDFLYKISDPSIKSVYGDFIENVNGHPVIPKNCGYRSLGTIIARRCKVYKNNRGRVRVNITDQTGHKLINLPCVAHDMEYKQEGEYHEIPIRLGLTRLWKKDGMEEAFYWIQISEVFSF